MGYKRKISIIERDEQYQKAIIILQNQEYKSIYAAARVFGVERVTLGRRIAGGNSRAQASQFKQILTNAEESTFVRWITRYTFAGSPLTPVLLKELAYLLRTQRVRHAFPGRPLILYLRPIGHKWIYRFLQRYPNVKSIYSRQINATRYNGAIFEVIKQWFNAVAIKFQEHNYTAEHNLLYLRQKK